MATDWNTSQEKTRTQQRYPEVIDAEEYDSITLVFHDSRVADNDAFDMPDPTD
ncbi:hypothetical protein [Halocatena pleomorpha]|uniref:hypothetical protein n=1 Tax=Halocatena pleomorpha TaxID=1785090 RepID=UPI00163A615E|nr:hypothetical protein [Halocatena pleomorpha]